MPDEEPHHSTAAPLRIGILANPDLKFSAWERRILERVAEDSRFEIVALLTDAREAKRPRSLLQKLATPELPNKLLRLVMHRLDQNAAGPETETPTPRLEALLKTLPKIELRPERRRFVDFFHRKEVEPVHALHLDVILRHAFGIIKGDILNAARFGIWSFHHADNRYNRGGPPGFWESLNRTPVTGATLQVLTPELDGGRVIARCWRTTETNAVRNSRSIYELSNTLLWRELQRLARNRSIETAESELYDGPLYTAPGARSMVSYMGGRVSNVAAGVLHRVREQIGLRPRMWTIGFGKGDIEGAALWRTKFVDPPANRFWADPFFFKHASKNYLFFEEYDYKHGRAWISVGEFDNGSFTYIGTALDAGYHMSFPFIYRVGEDIFMIPETTIKRRIEIWRAINFPNQWELHKTVLDDTDVADSVVHEHEGRWWLFTNICQTLDGDYCNELHIFEADGPLLDKIEPHPDNPVVIDSRSARNGGRPFYRNGRLYRPSQNNSYAIYGYGLNIMEITKLTPDHYNERMLRQASPSFGKDIIALHHVDQIDGYYVIDACRALGGRGKGA